MFQVALTPTVTRLFQKRNGRYLTVLEVKRPQIYNGHMQRPFSNGHKCPFGCSGYVTAMAVGQRQRLSSGVKMFTGNYLSPPPQIPRGRPPPP